MAEQLECIPANQVISTVERWVNSNYKSSRFIYTWTIDGFRTKIQLDDHMIYETFNEDQPRKLKWWLQIRPNESREDKSYIDFGLRLIRGAAKPVDTMLEFSILDPNGGAHVHKTASKCFYSNYQTEWFADVDRDSILSYEEPMIHDDRLTVRLVVYILSTTTTTGQSRSITDHVHELSEDYAQLLESESHSDVTLTVGTQAFKAHKAVLAARCPVFNRMFQHDMLERSKSTVTIRDIEPEVFREVLRFIYTGRITSDAVLSTMAYDLFAVADKYALAQLKEICEEFLTQTLTVETALDTLVAAEVRNAAELKARAIDFIKNHAAAVMVTDGWFAMARMYPHLLEEFLPHEQNTVAGPKNGREE